MMLVVGDGLSLGAPHSLPACSILLGSFSYLLGQARPPLPSLCLGPKEEDIFFSLEFQLENVQGRKIFDWSQAL